MHNDNKPLEQMLFCFNDSQNFRTSHKDDKCNILHKILLLYIYQH